MAVENDNQVLILAPLDQLSERVPKVVDSLRGHGIQPLLLGDLVDQDHPEHLVPEAAVMTALTKVSRVLVVPRPRGSIGAGTLRDLRLAERAGMRVSVVDPQGRIRSLSEATIIERGDNRQLAARITWPAEAAP
jgi:hypothetical protein